MQTLPLIMVAPNGAKRTKRDHPALPMTIGEIARTAAACHEAGAGAIHVHVRDQNGKHVLDGALYREAMAAVARTTGGRMLFQMTTEAVGHYRPLEQQAVVRSVHPEHVSVALSEMIPDESSESSAAEFYRWALEEGISVQHIVYEAREVQRLSALRTRGIIPEEKPQLLFVLGRHTANQQSDPMSLLPFLDVANSGGTGLEHDWAVCAFGLGETRCLAAALALGGKVRVGFENSLQHADGSLARDNAERVAEIAAIAAKLALKQEPHYLS